MVTAMPESPPWDGHAPAQSGGALALVLQEPFTIAIRLRSGRPVAADANSFRVQVKQLLAASRLLLRRVLPTTVSRPPTAPTA